MKIKQIRLKNFYGNTDKELVLDIPVSRTIFNLYQSEVLRDSFLKYESINSFFKVIPPFLLGRTSKVDACCGELFKNDLIEVTIVILSEGKEYSYSGLFFSEGKFYSESLYINNKLSIYYDEIDGISIGPGFEGSVEDEDRLIDFFTSYGFNKSFIFSRLTRMYTFLSTELRVLDLGENLTSDKILYNLGEFSYDTKNLVRKVIPELGFGILEVTDDWRLITEQDTKGIIGIDSHGSGLKTLLYILPELLECCQEDCYSKCLVLPGNLGNLHYALLRELFEFLSKKLRSKKEVQVICSMEYFLN